MTIQRPETVDIVIVNWNTGPYLADCLRSIAGAEKTVLDVGDVVVVDNASSDGSAGLPDIPGIRPKVVRNSSNRGFAVACNQGAGLGCSEYLLFLNPDTRLFPDALLNAGRFLRTEAAKGVGICGARMVGEGGRPAISCSRFPTQGTLFGQMTGLDRVLPSLFRRHHLRPEETPESAVVDQVIGAFVLMRRSLFTELGGFDERYFLYFEDVDLAFRARRRGWPSYFLSNVRVRHAENVSSGQVKARRLEYWLCSRCLFVFSHLPRRQARLLLVLSLSVEPAVRFAWAALGRGSTGFRDTIEGYRGFLRWLISTWDQLGQGGPEPVGSHPSVTRNRKD
jgi:hypothetical protein